VLVVKPFSVATVEGAASKDQAAANPFRRTTITSTDSIAERICKMSSALVGTVHHVSFRVDDLEKSLEFYRDLLGCIELDRPDLGVPGAWLTAGNTQVHLIEQPPSEALGIPPKATSPLACHVAFHVESLDLAEQLLKSHGICVIRGTLIPQLVVQDPSGNVIEFTEFS
jgi:glyoxylase I family protein